VNQFNKSGVPTTRTHGSRTLGPNLSRTINDNATRNAAVAPMGTYNNKQTGKGSSSAGTGSNNFLGKHNRHHTHHHSNFDYYEHLHRIKYYWDQGGNNCITGYGHSNVKPGSNNMTNWERGDTRTR